MGQGYICRMCNECPNRTEAIALTKEQYLEIRDLLKSGECTEEERLRYKAVFSGATWLFFCHENGEIVISPTSMVAKLWREK